MKSILLPNWNLFRIVRLILGIIIVAQAIIIKDALFGVTGLLFSLMAIFNTACCRVKSCNIEVPKPTKQKTENIIFEEIK